MDLNIKLKILENNTRENVCDIGLGKDFSDTKTWSMKEKTDKPDFLKVRILLSKRHIKRMQIKATV